MIVKLVTGKQLWILSYKLFLALCRLFQRHKTPKLCVHLQLRFMITVLWVT